MNHLQKIFSSFSRNASKWTMLLVNLGALVTVFCWGLSFVATKIVMEGGLTMQPDYTLSPTEAYIYRFVFAYAIIALIARKHLFCRTLRDEVLMAICGLTSGSLYFIAENTALDLTYTSNVSLLSATSPLVTILLVGLIYKSERPGRGIIIGSIVAFTGVICVIFNSAMPSETGINPLGDMLALSTAVFWAIYSLTVRRLNVVYDAMFITRKTFFYGLVTALPFLLAEHELRNPIEIVTHGWPMVDLSLLFLALFPSVLAFYLWALTVKYLGAVKANNYLYFQPIVTVFASALVLHETVGWLGYVGFSLILFGLWFGDYLQKRIGH